MNTSYAAAVRATGLRKTYFSDGATVPALHGVNLEVARGEFVYLAGPSGSGKTTLLSILGCVLTPDSGELQLLGRNVEHLSASDRAKFRRENIGFIFQRFHLFNALTAVENVCVPLNLLGWSPRRARDRAHHLLTRVGLESKVSARVTRLSVGQRQRVAFARALAGVPALVLADEPTASLDAASGANAMQMLKQMCRESGTTVVVVTHDSRIFQMADRILHLADGMLLNG